jgi:Zn-dependent membrane protease YugP
MTDHYDPRTNVVWLSDTVHDVPSVAAVGVAAHEVGHAIQHAKKYFPIRVRSAIIPVTRIGSMLAMPLFIIGLLLASEAFLLIGIVLYSAVTLFQLVTLPVEFNASRRALETLSRTSGGMMRKDEIRGAKSVLTAAAMTYVAALATSLLTLLRLLVLANGRRR